MLDTRLLDLSKALRFGQRIVDTLPARPPLLNGILCLLERRFRRLPADVRAFETRTELFEQSLEFLYLRLIALDM